MRDPTNDARVRLYDTVRVRVQYASRWPCCSCQVRRRFFDMSCRAAGASGRCVGFFATGGEAPASRLSAIPLPRSAVPARAPRVHRSFVELTGGASLAHNLARSLDQQIVRYSRQIGARIFDPIECATSKQPRESFLHKIGRGITPDPPPEIMEQPPSLGAIEGSEISPRTGRGKSFRPFSNIGGALAPDICTGQHCAAAAARQRARACTIW